MESALGVHGSSVLTVIVVHVLHTTQNLAIVRCFFYQRTEYSYGIAHYIFYSANLPMPLWFSEAQYFIIIIIIIIIIVIKTFYS